MTRIVAEQYIATGEDKYLNDLINVNDNVTQDAEPEAHSHWRGLKAFMDFTAQLSPTDAQSVASSLYRHDCSPMLTMIHNHTDSSQTAHPDEPKLNSLLVMAIHDMPMNQPQIHNLISYADLGFFLQVCVKTCENTRLPSCLEVLQHAAMVTSIHARNKNDKLKLAFKRLRGVKFVVED